jgi:uncharacterized membrane protein
MTVRPTLLDYLTLTVFGVQAAFALHIGFNGPTTPLPLHWNAAFEVDRWGTAQEFAIFFGGMTLIGFLATGGMGLAAMRATDDGDSSRARSLRLGQAVTLFVMAVLGILLAWMSLGDATLSAGPRVFMAGISLIFLGLGAFLGRIGPNPLIGVRTPWTYKSRLAWDRSNRLAGRLFCGLGLIGLIAAPIAPQPQAQIALIAAVILSALWSVFESWRVWRDDPDRQPF